MKTVKVKFISDVHYRGQLIRKGSVADVSENDIKQLLQKEVIEENLISDDKVNDEVRESGLGQKIERNAQMIEQTVNTDDENALNDENHTLNDETEESAEGEKAKKKNNKEK